MADVSGAAARFRHDGQFDATDFSVERRDAGADRRARGGVFRESVRDNISRAAAQQKRRTRARGRAFDAFWHGVAHGRVRAARTFSNSIYPPARPADATIDRLANQHTAKSLKWSDADIARGKNRHSIHTRDGTDGFMFAADSVWTVAGVRAQIKNAARPDLGLWPARIDATHRIHRHWLLKTDPDDFQGAVPSAPRRAARI